MEPPEVLTVPTPYGDIAVHLRGRSPTSAPGLLLLHANPGDHRDFDEIVPALAAGWAIAAVDWPGYGASTVVDPALVTIDALAEVAVLVAEALARNGFGALTVLGNSAGGYAAVRLAQRAPDLVRGVVLVQSAGFAPRNILTRALFRAVASPAVAARFIGPHARLYLGPLDRGGVRAIYERARAVRDQPARLGVYRSLWRSFDGPRFELAAEGRLLPGVPVRVVWGRLDPTNPWFVNRRGVARALPQAEVTVLSTRHEPFAEAPELFLATVREFLAACAGMRP
ncbi:alpha/beta fold hydrolase [Nocardia sp. NPDC050717]|uniref:alpha/beta fold hydrolase n=1 Tax=Nocardia sp. NPDC050717 TaxID=3157221 RepID=UPI003407D044